MRRGRGDACRLAAEGQQTRRYERVEAEYQKAFDSVGTSPRGLPYTPIDTRTSEGNVRITLTMFPFEFYQPATQCRNFNEVITVNGALRSNLARRACRDAGKPWVIFAA